MNDRLNSQGQRPMKELRETSSHLQGAASPDCRRSTSSQNLSNGLSPPKPSRDIFQTLPSVRYRTRGDSTEHFVPLRCQLCHSHPSSASLFSLSRPGAGCISTNQVIKICTFSRILWWLKADRWKLRFSSPFGLCVRCLSCLLYREGKVILGPLVTLGRKEQR